ncbi:unnamed protein product [Prunus armeniaca]|uniref:Uncharacterized protein n=1 Tax=Prunus armeniaca TaxID=36596 RepID=A0A6J5VF79_PRUAR|nr:unnamed protein product [Prunus armeniaca]
MEDMEAIRLRKQEAMIKRGRMKKYSFSLRESRNVQMLDDSMIDNATETLTVHLDQTIFTMKKKKSSKNFALSTGFTSS